jgi:[ribosomal protein S18]-alanine N-acetyltransferase
MRRAIKNDTIKLAELETLLFPDNSMNETTLANELELGECWLYTTPNDEEICGYVLVRRDGELLDILRLGVHPKRQRTGIGTALLEQVLSSQPTMLTVKKANSPALKLYLRHGFRVVGVLANEGGWIMKR